MVNLVLFVAIPYLALGLAIIMGIYRFKSNRFSISSLSSQFLENRGLFWGIIGWHYGIVIILLAHLLALIFPAPWMALVSSPTRLYVLEITGISLGLWALAGMVILVLRRLSSPRVRAVTSPMDWVLAGVLLIQVSLGVTIAIFYRWGTEWYLHTAVPWLVSLATLHPRVEPVASLPWVVKLHMVGGFVVIGLLPFTRLVHLLALPISYLWRPYQVVIWNRRKARGGAVAPERSSVSLERRESLGGARGL